MEYILESATNTSEHIIPQFTVFSVGICEGSIKLFSSPFEMDVLINEKTPVTALMETCAKYHKSAPQYEILVDGANGLNNTKIFQYRVRVCADLRDIVVDGPPALSKQAAKHDASQAMLDKLRSITKTAVVQCIPVETPKPKELDYISALTNKCVTRNWPVPTFEAKEVTGPPHLRQFTMSCMVGRHIGEGRSATKKGAQQLAAEMVLRSITADEANNTIAVSEPVIQPIEEVISTFRKLTRRNRRKINSKEVPLMDRHRYFESFPDENIEAARAILCGVHDYEEFSAKEKVLLVLGEFSIPHATSSMHDRRGRSWIVFELTGDYDAVFFETSEEKIWPKAVEYLKNMLNINLLY